MTYRRIYRHKFFTYPVGRQVYSCIRILWIICHSTPLVSVTPLYHSTTLHHLTQLHKSTTACHKSILLHHSSQSYSTTPSTLLLHSSPPLQSAAPSNNTPLHSNSTTLHHSITPLNSATPQLILLHSEPPKLYGVLAVLSARGLSSTLAPFCLSTQLLNSSTQQLHSTPPLFAAIPLPISTLLYNSTQLCNSSINPTALRAAKTLWSSGSFECSTIKLHSSTLLPLYSTA